MPRVLKRSSKMCQTFTGRLKRKSICVRTKLEASGVAMAAGGHSNITLLVLFFLHLPSLPFAGLRQWVCLSASVRRRLRSVLIVSQRFSYKIWIISNRDHPWHIFHTLARSTKFCFQTLIIDKRPEYDRTRTLVHSKHSISWCPHHHMGQSNLILHSCWIRL